MDMHTHTGTCRVIWHASSGVWQILKKSCSALVSLNSAATHSTTRRLELVLAASLASSDMLANAKSGPCAMPPPPYLVSTFPPASSPTLASSPSLPRALREGEGRSLAVEIPIRYGQPFVAHRKRWLLRSIRIVAAGKAPRVSRFLL